MLAEATVMYEGMPLATKHYFHMFDRRRLEATCKVLLLIRNGYFGKEEGGSGERNSF